MNTNTPELAEASIDLSYMDMMADGDNDMKKIMLELLFEEPVQEIESMYPMLKSEDWDSIERVSHKMKSTLAFVGNDTLTETNKKIEHNSKNRVNLEKLPELIKILDVLYKKVLVQLKAEYDRLG